MAGLACRRLASVNCQSHIRRRVWCLHVCRESSCDDGDVRQHGVQSTEHGEEAKRACMWSQLVTVAAVCSQVWQLREFPPLRQAACLPILPPPLSPLHLRSIRTFLAGWRRTAPASVCQSRHAVPAPYTALPVRDGTPAPGSCRTCSHAVVRPEWPAGKAAMMGSQRTTGATDSLDVLSDWARDDQAAAGTAEKGGPSESRMIHPSSR